jgi:hypothetical protein
LDVQVVYTTCSLKAQEETNLTYSLDMQGVDTTCSLRA